MKTLATLAGSLTGYSRVAARRFRQIYSTIADHIEREESVGNSFKGITIYPALVGTVLMVVLGVIFIFVIPVFREMFENLGGSFPLPTRILVAASGLLKEILPFLIMGIVALVITFSVNRNLRYAFVDMVPLLGRANRKAAGAEFMMTFSVLSGLGIPADQGLVAAAESISNDHLARKLRAMAHQNGQLDAFIDEMRRTGFLTDFTVLMLRAGERSGTVATACSETARAVFEEAELFNRRFLGMAVPLMMASLGVVVGFIIIALYLPIFRMITLI